MGEVLLSEHGLTLEKTDDGLIRAHLDGTQDIASEDADAFFDRIREVMKANAPVLHLLDGRDIAIESLALRWKLAQHMSKQSTFIKKSAIVSHSATTRILASVVVRTSGRKNVRFFKTMAEAEAWLIGDD
jgi:hypothetical protein